MSSGRLEPIKWSRGSGALGSSGEAGWEDVGVLGALCRDWVIMIGGGYWMLVSLRFGLGINCVIRSTIDGGLY